MMAALVADRAIPIRDATRVHPTIDLTGEAPMGLRPQVVQIDLIDQTTHSAMQFSPRCGGVVAIRAADDANAAMFQAANDGFLFHLIARKAIETFEQKN